MLSAVVVDDEKWMISLIKRLIDVPQVEIVGETQKSREAVELVHRTKPDVVITDIRMPGMNGLELVEEIKKEFPDMEFIMVSGYQDFEYAYQELKLGVCEYLLKPVKQEELRQTLNKLVKKKEPGRIFGKSSSCGNAEGGDKSSLRKDFMRRIVNGMTEPVSVEYVDQVKRSGLFKDESVFKQGIMVKIDNLRGKQPITVNDMNRYVVGICENLKGDLEKAAVDVEYITDADTGYLLIFHDNSTAVRAILQKRCSIYIKEENLKYGGYLAVTAGIGSLQDDFKDVPMSFYHAQQALRSRIECGCGECFTYSRRNQWNGQKILMEEELGQFVQCLHSLDHTGAQSAWQNYFSRIEIPEGKGGYYFALTEQVLTMIEMELCTLVDFPSDFPESRKYKEALDSCGRKEQLSMILSTYLGEAMDFCGEKLRSREGRLIRQAKDFVMENYSKPIGLNEAARVVSLNPVYFSTVFKEQTGENFTVFLQNVRISKSKELLKNTRLTVKKVAEQVGYMDEKYFSRLFMKVTGVKPVEYRKFYS